MDTEARWHVRTEAEVRVMQLKPRTPRKAATLEAGKTQEGSSPRAFGGAWLCPHLDFGLVDSRTVTE